MKRKRDCRQMMSDRISAIGPVWDAESVKGKIKAMKIAAKKKYSDRFEADGSEKAQGAGRVRLRGTHAHRGEVLREGE